jgi:hypothetical protein
MVILDFSKAFDKVLHQQLLKTVENYGIRSTTAKWIKSFLTGRTQRVLVEGQSSATVPVTSGVPQGSVLGPLLFLIYINDLPECVQSSTRLFADDCILYRQIRSRSDQEQLQKDLDALAEWERTWGMEFHPQKCSLLRITRSKTPKQFQYHLKGVTLTEDRTSKYLGVDLESNLAWRRHIDRTSKKANNMLGFLRRNLHKASENTKSKAYKAIVRPHLEYCCSVWNPHQKDLVRKLEMVQRRAARFTTNRYRNTSSVTDMLEQLNWESLQTRREKVQLTMLYKIVNDLVDIPSSTYLKPHHSRTRASHKHRFQHYSTSTDYFKYSFFPRTIPAWNKLPATTAEAPSLASFKRELSSQPF